jgi:hypothetical protein
LQVSDGKIETLLDLKDFRRVVTPWAAWLGLTPQGDTLLIRDTGSQEVYALDLETPKSGGLLKSRIRASSGEGNHVQSCR